MRLAAYDTVARSDAHCPHHADDRRRMRPRSQVRSPLELNGRGRVRDAKGSTHRSAKFQRELTIAGTNAALNTCGPRAIARSMVPWCPRCDVLTRPLPRSDGGSRPGCGGSDTARDVLTSRSDRNQQLGPTRPTGGNATREHPERAGFLTGRLSSKSFFRICAATHRPGFCGAPVAPRIPNAQGGSSRHKLHRPAVSHPQDCTCQRFT